MKNNNLPCAQNSKKSYVKCVKRKIERESLKEGSHEEWGEIFACDCLQT
jgi:hypothetical protein